ncbi:MAG: iron-only hydrogenase system regulator [Lachnospiraceae bacterium]|nr:iron-only hydrogenase system regulator [Lachnospiraceae bacterium]
MENRVAVVSIIVENTEAAERINAILHEYNECIIGRMGIPYRKRQINLICVALDASQNIISSMAGKIGELDGVSVKTAYSSAVYQD